MSDHAEAISNLLGYQTDEGYMKYEPVLNLFDTNNGSYGDGRINFDTDTLKNSLIDYHNSYLETNLQINGTGLDGAGIQIAIKNAVYQLISGFQLKINNIDVINTDYLPVYNSFKMYLHGDKEWADTHGDLYHFSKDDKDVNNDDDTNDGFLNRIEILNLVKSGVSATTLTFTARIPLKMVSSYFEALDRPLINARMQPTFSISGVNGDRFFPIIANPASLATSLTILNGCRWVVYRCELQPESAIKFNQNLAKGLVVETNFWQAKHFKGTQTTNLTDQSFTITSGIRAPRRIMACFMNETDWASNTSCSPAVTNNNNKFVLSNIEINNERIFMQDVKDDYEHYKLLQREMFSGEDQNSNGCLVPYRDFLRANYAYYVYNISNSKYIIKDPNASVQLRFIGTKTLKSGGTDAELHCFVEHEVNVTFNMTTSEVLKSGD